MKKQYSLYISNLYGMFNGARMLAVTINSAYLMLSGLSLAQIATLNMFLSLSVLIFEIPTGFVSDIFGKKKSVLLSCIFFSTHYFLYLYAPNMILLIIAQIFMGIGLSFSSGSFEGWITEVITDEFEVNSEAFIYYGFYRAEILAFITILSGVGGAVIVYLFSNKVIYIISSLIMLVFLYILYKIPENKSKMIRLKLNDLKVKILLQKMININFFYYLLMNCFLSGVYFILYSYWQPLFISMKFDINTNILLGGTFFVYSFFRYYTNKILKKYIHKKDNLMAGIIASVISIITIYMIILNFNLLIFVNIFLFGIVHSCLAVIEVVSEAQFLKDTNRDVISSGLSIISAVSRIVSITIAYVTSKTINENNLLMLFGFSMWFYFALLIIFCLWNHVKEVKKI